MSDNSSVTGQRTTQPWYRDVITGTVVTVPVLLVYFAMGVTYGVLALERGFSDFNTVLMSALVYAGTAQLVGVEMMASAVPVSSVLITTLVINSRFFVMAASLTPNLENYSLGQRVFYGLQLTDATFALNTARFAAGRPSKIEIFTTAITGHLVWIGSTMAGVVIGRTVGNLNAYGVDFAMPAMFIALMTPLIRSRTQVVVAVAAGAATLVCFALGFAYWTILCATLVGVLVGFVRERWTKTLSA
ncbi:MAG: AzlC family ABC transporter permease [Alphaproteobacteria bacterium]|nr:AzlC family ABC transporter permease [Alphaproteobacteria bacterium]